MKDLFKKFQNIIVVFVIDVTRGLVFGLTLWNICKLNMFAAYCYIVRYYGVFILFFGSAVINGVRCYIIIIEKDINNYMYNSVDVNYN